MAPGGISVSLQMLNSRAGPPLPIPKEWAQESCLVCLTWWEGAGSGQCGVAWGCDSQLPDSRGTCWKSTSSSPHPRGAESETGPSQVAVTQASV